MNAENKMNMHGLRVLHPAVESHTPVKNPHDLIPEGGKAQGCVTSPLASQVSRVSAWLFWITTRSMRANF